MIVLKSPHEIAIMREANRILALLFEHLAPMVQPGITTAELDAEAELFIRSHHASPAFKGYRGYPCTLCTSVNEEVIHGIPSSRRLMAGDIVSIDVGALHEGFYSDASRTFALGEVSPKARRLMEVTEKALSEGISQAAPGNRLHDISAAIQKVVESAGFHVVREFVGHGIGRSLHEDPQIPNFGRKGTGPVLEGQHPPGRVDRGNCGRFALRPLRAQHRRHRERAARPERPVRHLHCRRIKGQDLPGRATGTRVP
jgi:methionyl aminopeptidase